MTDIWMDVDTALAEVPVNVMPLIDDTDFKSIEDAVVYNAAGMALKWHFVTTAGAMTETAVVPTTGGVHDWTDQGTSGLYALEIPASAGTINNDTEGFGWFTGVATGILPWRGPTIGFRAAGLNALMVDDAFSATRGLAGTALPAAAADAAGGLPISDLGGFAVDGTALEATLGTPTDTNIATDLSNLQGDTDDIQTRIPATLVGGRIDANVGAISGSATAADNEEAQFDGTTGLTGDLFPATQSQLSGIANVGSAAHKAFTGETLTTPATTTGGSYVDTEALDSVYMFWDSVTGGFEAELTTNIGAGTPSGIKITGYMNGANDSVRVQMWDFQAGTPAWVTIGSWSGGGSTVNQVLPYDAFIGMVGVGVNLGDIRLRLYNDNGGTDTALTSANIYIDQVFVEFNESAVSTLDAVYFDSGASNTGTTSVDGTPGNPVSTEAAVNTLLADRNLSQVKVALDSSITFATDHAEELWAGTHWEAGLGGRDFTGAHLRGADVSGIGTGSSPIDFSHCNLGTCTLDPFHTFQCGLSGTITLATVGNYVISVSHSRIAGSTTPIIDMGAALGNVNLAMPDYSNGIEIRNLNAAGTDIFSISGQGQIIYAASCSGSVEQRGDWKETNTGGVTIVRDGPAQNTADILVDTADMQPKLGTPVVTISDDIAANQTDLDQIIADIAALNDLSAAQVNAEVDTALATTTYAEPGAVPAATASIEAKVGWICAVMRNILDQTATSLVLRNDGDTGTIGTAPVSDDGTNAIRGKFV